MSTQRQTLVAAGALLLGLAFFWPSTLWFRDEVGYVGQARLVLEGHLRPEPRSVLFAWPTPSGPVAAYPFAFPLILAVPLAVAPRLVFVVPVIAALLLAFAAARKFESWGRSWALGLAILAYPTTALLTRTAMADVPLAAATVFAWYAVGRDKRLMSSVAFAVLGLLKPVGIVLAVGLVAGEFIRRWSGPNRQPSRFALAELSPAILGAVVSLGCVLALNVAATGSVGYPYAHSGHGFAFRNLALGGPTHLVTLLVLPPGLLFGAIALWRRREYSALTAASLLLSLMSFFSFVDTTPGMIERLTIQPRLILPAVVLLLMGWLDGLATPLERLLGRRTIAGASAAALLASSLAAGALLAPQERVRRDAREFAESALKARGGHLLGLGDAAFAAGLLTRAHVSWAAPDTNAAEVVLCGITTESRRRPITSTSCDLPGYTMLREIGPYRVLGRQAR